MCFFAFGAHLSLSLPYFEHSTVICGHHIEQCKSGPCLWHSPEGMASRGNQRPLNHLSQMISSRTKPPNCLWSLWYVSHIRLHPCLKTFSFLIYKTWRSQFLSCSSLSPSYFEQLLNPGFQAGAGSTVPVTLQLPEGHHHLASHQHLRPNILDQPYLLLPIPVFPWHPVLSMSPSWLNKYLMSTYNYTYYI